MRKRRESLLRQLAMGSGILGVSGGPSDTTAPTVTEFAATTPSSSLTITITACAATDDVGVTGYKITENNTPPEPDAEGWSALALDEYTVSANGDYSLYLWAKDAAGNVSAEFAPASVLVLLFELNDEFNTARAAGAVNGTAAEPGAGTRAVADTENKLTIANSVLTFAGGKATPAWGDPALFLDAVSRAAGKMFIGHFNTSNAGASGGINIGWGTDTTAALLKAHGIYIGNARTLAGYDNNAQDISIATAALAINTNYYLMIALRATGSFWFIKGGIFTDWTLLHIGTVNSTATLYPALSNKSTVYNSEFLHVPANLWLPTPLVSDGFGAATSDGLGHAETSGLGAGGNGATWTGATWTVNAGVVSNSPTLGAEQATGALTIGTWYSITATEVDHFYTGSAIGDTFRATAETALDANNKVKALTLSQLFRTTPVSTADVMMEVQLPAIGASQQSGVILRADSASDPQNFLLVYRTKGNLIKIVECVNGTYSSDIASVSNAYAANERMRVSVRGTDVRVYKVTAAGVVSNIGSGATNVTTGTIHGTFATVATTTFDNLTIYKKTYTDNLLTQAAKVKSRTGAVVLTFDDGRTSIYSEAYSYMASKGMVGTAYVISGFVGTPTYATYDQLREMDAAGWSIGNHSNSGTDLSTLSQEQVETALSTCKNALDGQSLTRASMHLAYPSGNFNATVIAAMSAQGILTGRDDSGGLFDYRSQALTQLLSVGVVAATTAASLQQYIYDAMNLGKIALFMLHDINASPSGFDWSITEFRAFIDFLFAQGITPITINQLYTKMTE